jgi:Zn-dependent peptidase ImmA (M78 family)
MTTSDYTTEPHYTLAKAKAKELWVNLCNSAIPIKLDTIVKALNISVKCENFTSTDGCARLDSNGIAMIMYSKNSSTVRQRFTVAHELGHIVLEHITFGSDSSQISSKLQEREANAFAGELLVPASDLRKFMKGKDKTLDDVQKQYWVSKDVAVRAINQNKLLNKLKIDED